MKTHINDDASRIRCAADAPRDHVALALAALADGELAALADATRDLSLIAPGLRGWIRCSRAWEGARRAGGVSPRPLSDSVIPAGEAAGSIVGALMMRYKFSHAPLLACSAFAALFDAIVGELVGRDASLQ